MMNFPSPSAATIEATLFYALAALTLASAIGVVVSRNIVRTAVALLFALISIAGLYVLLNAEFLAAVQLVVYVGGTLILIIFGVMLTSKSPFTRFDPSALEIFIAAACGLALLATLIAAIASAHFHTETPLGGAYPIEALGRALLGDFLAPFELASVLLLVVMIGAAYLAKGRRNEDAN